MYVFGCSFLANIDALIVAQSIVSNGRCFRQIGTIHNCAVDLRQRVKAMYILGSHLGACDVFCASWR